jgi:hypothetical protein
MDITVLRQIERISTFHKDCIYIGKGWNSVYDTLEPAIKLYNPDVIFYAADFDYNDAHIPLKTDNILQICMMQDYWDDIEKRINILKNFKFPNVIVKNSIGFEYYKDKFPNIKIEINPSGYDDNIFKNETLEKEYDILISGMCNMHKYPTRKRFADIALSLKSQLNIHQEYHPGYNNAVKTQSDYNIILNKSKFAIAGSALNINVHMQKFWEISATSAICITDLNPLEKNYNLLKSHVYELDRSKSDDELKEEFVWLVKNYDILKNNVIKYNRIVESYASIDNRTIQLLNSIYKLYRCI